MKRMIALLLCLALVCSFATTAFAAEITEDSETQSTMSQIVYNLVTKYCIYIPEQIDAGTGSYTFAASYLAVSETEQVVVRMSGVDDLGNITLENGASEKLTLNVVYDLVLIIIVVEYLKVEKAEYYYAPQCHKRDEYEETSSRDTSV